MRIFAGSDAASSSAGFNAHWSGFWDREQECGPLASDIASEQEHVNLIDAGDEFPSGPRPPCPSLRLRVVSKCGPRWPAED